MRSDNEKWKGFDESSVEDLWEDFGNISIDEYECIESEFMDFPIGTHREEIWQWFDEVYPGGVYDLMYKIRKK